MIYLVPSTLQALENDSLTSTIKSIKHKRLSVSKLANQPTTKIQNNPGHRMQSNIAWQPQNSTKKSINNKNPLKSRSIEKPKLKDESTNTELFRY